MTPRLHTLLGLLLGLVGGASGPAQARPAPGALATPAIERVADIRARLQAHGDGLQASDSPAAREALVAQWFNGPNWANWANWAKWSDWNNWNNRLKWGKY